MAKTRETFGSRMGMLLAMAGSAIGLGNKIGRAHV